MVAAPGKEKGVLSPLTVAFRDPPRGTAILRNSLADMAIHGNFEHDSKQPELITVRRKGDPGRGSDCGALRTEVALSRCGAG
jgi:hypothetical protein